MANLPPIDRGEKQSVQIAEAKVRRGDIEYTIPVDMSRCVGQQIRIAMLAIRYSTPPDECVLPVDPDIETPDEAIMNQMDKGIERYHKLRDIIEARIKE